MVVVVVMVMGEETITPKLSQWVKIFPTIKEKSNQSVFRGITCIVLSKFDDAQELMVYAYWSIVGQFFIYFFGLNLYF